MGEHNSCTRSTRPDTPNSQACSFQVDQRTLVYSITRKPRVADVLVCLLTNHACDYAVSKVCYLDVYVELSLV